MAGATSPNPVLICWSGIQRFLGFCMELYFIRHGIAIEPREDYPDFDRPLTDLGRAKTLAVAEALRILGLQFDRLLTSPLRRALQTATLLEQARLAQTVEVWTELAPGGSVQALTSAFNQWNVYPTNSSLTARVYRVALVGHEPDLSQWVEALIWGEVLPENATDQRLILKKAGIIGLRLPDRPPCLGNSQLFWLTPPRFLIMS